MERLTIRNSDGSVSQPTNLNWAAALEKLAAYEDTGLEPGEIEAVAGAEQDGEYIDKQAFLEHMKKTDRYFDVKFDIEDFPTADVATVRHGKIVETIENGKMKRVFTCCGEDFTKLTQWYMPDYCPNCGAKMDLEAGHG